MVALRVLCFFLVVAVVAAQLGGKKTADPNDAETVKAEKLARAKIAQVAEVCDEGIKVVKHERQTVNGVIYYITYEADPSACGGTGAKKTCTIEVVTKRGTESFTRNESCA